MDEYKKILLGILLDVMRPFARLLLNAGVTYHEFEGLVRKAFVDVAGKDQFERGKSATPGRIAAAAGMSRADVMTVLERVEDPAYEISSLRSEPSDVLHFWQHDSAFSGDDGRPLLLPFDGVEPSFTSLVAKHGHGLSAASLKDVLLEVGSIVEAEGGLLKFQKPYFIPARVEDRLLVSLRQNIRALLSTVAYNSDTPRRGPGRIERFVYTDALTEGQIQSLRSSIRTTVQEFTEEVDEQFSQLEELNRQSSHPSAGRTVAVGVYFFEEDEYSK